MLNLKIVSFLIIILLSHLTLFSQNKGGVVLDLTTGKTLAFVNIRFGDSKQGTTTDIDGKFSFPKSVTQLHLFYVGYFDTLITVGNEKLVKVEMRPKVTSLTEVEIFPGVNPAHRIIGQAIKNRKQ
ncbi:MAG: carboxypeptidase-like regulatory domain-containing protein, partial [Bacteroidales bacterium]|nr:carboxypeptidase-like regulatory domain-containing protein [Bacteroidales bacterium]